MPEGGFREEVLNVTLAQLLEARGIVSDPERSLRAPQGRRRMPDVLVLFRGLRTVIEGKVDDHPGAEAEVLTDTRRKVEDGIAHIGVALLYPASLRQAASLDDLRQQLGSVALRMAVCTEAGDRGWADGSVDYLAELLRRTFEQLVTEDVVVQSVDDLEDGLSRFAHAMRDQQGAVERSAAILGIGESEGEARPVAVSRRRETVGKIAALTIINAMIFQEVLAQNDPRVHSLRDTLQEGDLLSELSEHWRFILEQVDYVSIFTVARGLLLELPNYGEVVGAVRFLGSTALKIVGRRAALRHDLMGRVYHRLLVEAKFLGTFYTSVPAATLLLKMALHPRAWLGTDWADAERVSSFRIADLACGTGTLLMAAAEAVTDNHVQACAVRGEAHNLEGLHRNLMEKVLHGYDVLASAIHLTASTLALRASHTTFEEPHLYGLELGGPYRRLGSVEFLRSRTVHASLGLFPSSRPGQVTGAGYAERLSVTLPDLDLCVMNPPFTRSVGGNLLFGSMPAAERTAMQRDLGRLLRDQSAQASATAGLGSVFVAVGDRAVKAGGRMALVLPKALLSGVAWGKTRGLLAQRYQLECLIVSHDPARWNFSENTDLSEVLVVARKLGGDPARDQAAGVVCVNLWHNPTTAVEALSIAHALAQASPPDVEHGQGAQDAHIGDWKVGEVIATPWVGIKDGLWMLPCAFAQSELIRAAHALVSGNLYLPGQGVCGSIALCPLGGLGELGPDVRDIHDGFSVGTEPTAYPALWGHDATECMTLARSPNRYLSPLPQARRGRPLRRATDLWPRAGNLALAERLRLNTQRLVALRVSQRVLSNVWWPLALRQSNETVEKALVVWLNSTLGLTMLLARREETEGPWVKFKKPVLGAMPVLDVLRLSDQQRWTLAETFDRLCDRELLPLPRMEEDLVRAEIDCMLAEVLGLPDLSILRSFFAREPVVCLQPMGV